MSKTNQKLGVVAFWLSWPGLWFYLHGSKRTRLVLRVGDEILVNKAWLGDGRWGLPGGGLHEGEDAVAGVIRETLEETGIAIKPEQIRTLGPHRYRNHGLSFDCQYFTAELPAKPAVQQQRNEIVATTWVRITDVMHDTSAAKKYGPDVLTGLIMLQ